MPITHCDVFAGFREGVCARSGAEVTVKQQQLRSGVRGDRNQDSHMFFSEDALLPYLG